MVRPTTPLISLSISGGSRPHHVVPISLVAPSRWRPGNSHSKRWLTRAHNCHRQSSGSSSDFRHNDNTKKKKIHDNKCLQLGIVSTESILCTHSLAFRPLKQKHCSECTTYPYQPYMTLHVTNKYVSQLVWQICSYTASDGQWINV